MQRGDARLGPVLVRATVLPLLGLRAGPGHRRTAPVPVLQQARARMQRRGVCWG
jgi:hypothetical protein